MKSTDLAQNIAGFIGFASTLFYSGWAMALDPAEIKEAFRKCVPCHEVGPGAKHKVGPPLNGIVDRKIAGVDGYKYSRAFENAANQGLIWTKENLDAYLTKPAKFIKGTKMNFVGVKETDKRHLIIDWLATFDADGNDVESETATASLDRDEGNNSTLLGANAATLEGDKDFGQYLSGECVTCHKPSGEDDGIPSITGWPKEIFVHAMYEYKMKVRTNPVMQNVAGRLSDEELASLAVYFGSLE